MSGLGVTVRGLDALGSDSTTKATIREQRG